MIDYNKFYKSFINIPFLDLGPIENFDAIYKESNLAYNNSQLLTMHSRNPTDNTYLNLDVQGVFDFKGFPEISAHCESCLTDFKLQDKLHVPFATAEITKATPFSKKVPAITSYIKNTLEHPGRARFSVLKAKKDVGWHAHYYYGEKHTELTLHMSIKTNPKVLAEVGYCNFKNLNKFEDWFDPPAQVHSKHFSQGRLWLLNSRHSHRFVNPSDEDRIHMWITTYFYDNKGNATNHKLAEMISEAISNYDGEYLKPN